MYENYYYSDVLRLSSSVCECVICYHPHRSPREQERFQLRQSRTRTSSKYKVHRNFTYLESVKFCAKNSRWIHLCDSAWQSSTHKRNGKRKIQTSQRTKCISTLRSDRSFVQKQNTHIYYDRLAWVWVRVRASDELIKIFCTKVRHVYLFHFWILLLICLQDSQQWKKK